MKMPLFGVSLTPSCGQTSQWISSEIGGTWPLSLTGIGAVSCAHGEHLHHIQGFPEEPQPGEDNSSTEDLLLQPWKGLC